MPAQKRFTHGLFRCRRCSVARRAPENRQTDSDFAARETNGFQHMIQQDAGGAGKGFAQAILVASGGFADHHDPGQDGAAAENQALRRLA